MNIRTSFRFTLPNGNGIKAEAGRKVSGTMRLITVKDLVLIETSESVKQRSGMFYVILLAKVITELGQEKMLNRNIIEKLTPEDFSFLVDFLHEINHQVIKNLPITCGQCGHQYFGAIQQLGEA
jgi:translation initiation factor IF-1